MLHSILHWIKGKPQQFKKLCVANNLSLSYRNNHSEIEVLIDVFYNRTYAPYFPFYHKATVVDVGAHYGYFALFAANNLAQGANIIAVEPNSANYQHLIENTQSLPIQCSNHAIGASNGEVKLYRGQNINHSIFSSYPLANKEVFEMVEMLTLESLFEKYQLKHIDFLKLDCEGAEYAIIEHTPKAVFDKITTIFMEFHDLKQPEYTAQTLIDQLQKMGFAIMKFSYDVTYRNLNYGKIIATKLGLTNECAI